MKILSIKQPWAWLIVEGLKDVENRTWYTNFRGKFLVHAGKSFDDLGYYYLLHWGNTKEKKAISEMLPSKSDFYKGGIVGISEVVNCVTKSESIWFEGPFGFMLGESRPLDFIPLKGKLGFFESEELKIFTAKSCKILKDNSVKIAEDEMMEGGTGGSRE
ncbi:MAG: ASCH domain-containing protein [Ignavibacteriae bacterium]|nr:ASCH domain-containing protein [Ignavibacteriota bacterium]